MLVGGLSLVAIILGAGGALLINGIVETTADRLLGASARAISETLAVEDGEITLDLPPFALGMLENTERDNIYYSVRHNGALITGYPDLAQAPVSGAASETPTFRYDRFHGARIRIAADVRSLPRVSGPIVVQVAETLEARRDLSRRMFAGLAVLEVMLVTIAGLLVWPAVRWSMKPVTRLRAHMDARQDRRAAFAELPLAGVPVELTALVVGFNALLGRLENSVEGMRRFTADASHQMRTPLTILRAHLGVLRKHPPETEAGRSSVADITHATDRLQSLLTGLIALARTEDGALVAPAPEIDLCALVRAAASEFVPLASRSRVRMSVETPPGAIMARSDPMLLNEVLANLIDNAVRYNRKGGQVTIRVLREADRCGVEVEDNGPGVPAAYREKIFQRFYRLARDQGEAGSGLGLSIVDAIVHRLNAQIAVADGDHGGLKVTIWL